MRGGVGNFQALVKTEVKEDSGREKRCCREGGKKRDG
jgi:hypothetical protein